MARKRASEQFTWSDANLRTLKLCLAGSMSFVAIAKRLGTDPETISIKAHEEGFKRPAPERPQRASRTSRSARP